LQIKIKVVFLQKIKKSIMEVSEKNTKAEILKAYETLLKDVQAEKADIPKQVQEEKQRKEILEKVAGFSSEGYH